MVQSDGDGAVRMVRLGRCKNKSRGRSREQIKFRDFELHLMFLLGFLSLGNKLAQFAGMFAVEGFGQGFGEGG